MKMTIGKKLGLGFGVVIGLLAVSSGIAYYNLAQMRSNVSEALDVAVPTVQSCDRLYGAINRAAAALRGYLIAGTDAKRGDNFKAENHAAWEQVEAEFILLSKYLSDSKNGSLRQEIDTLTRGIQAYRSYHEQIIEIAATEDNIPAQKLFSKEVAPRMEQLGSLLSTIIEEEAALEPSVERRKLLVALAELRWSCAMSMAELREFVTAGDETSRAAFNKHWNSTKETYQTISRSAKEFVSIQKSNWERFVSISDELASWPSQVIQLREADDWNQAEFIWNTQSAPQSREIRSILVRITEAANVREKTERGELEAASRNTVGALFGATTAAIVVGCCVAFLLSRNMANTVRALADRAQQISKGDLTGKEILMPATDELGQLADSFNFMMGNLRDLTGQILSVTKNVSSAASQISSSAKQQASSTKEQAATVQEITSTMQEISQSGAQIVAKAREVAAAAEAASQSSKSGMDAVQNTNRTMEAIREQVEDVAENIVALSEKTQAVGEIIATVNDIAEQSNLLALNATIEAADAGDEGSRFSVVAAEMKNLADQAKQCTAHVRKILGEIQKAINTSVMLTEEAVKRVESGKKQADVSENVIRQITDTTEESIQAFQQIIGATNQQQVGFEQVARGMQDIDQATQQTATGTAQLEQAVVSLSALGKQLQTAVSSYKI